MGTRNRYVKKKYEINFFEVRQNCELSVGKSLIII